MQTGLSITLSGCFLQTERWIPTSVTPDVYLLLRGEDNENYLFQICKEKSNNSLTQSKIISDRLFMPKQPCWKRPAIVRTDHDIGFLECSIVMGCAARDTRTEARSIFTPVFDQFRKTGPISASWKRFHNSHCTSHHEEEEVSSRDNTCIWEREYNQKLIERCTAGSNRWIT